MSVLLLFKFWTSSIVTLFLNHYVSRDVSSLDAPSTGPTRVGAPEDEGSAIPQNVVV
jgi:hypothetical protein